MKKKALIAALAAVLILAGCSNGNKPAETTTAAPAATTMTAATTAETTTTEAATTTTTEATTTAPETEATFADTAEDGVPIDPVTFSAGTAVLYRKDATGGDERMPEFDVGLVRISTGTYYDSISNPDYFVPDEFTYKGNVIPFDDVKILKAGDKVGDLTVTEASTTFDRTAKDFDEDFNAKSYGWYVFSSETKFDGEVTLTGYARYYSDEQYLVSSGEIRFIPDSSYAGLPVPVTFDNLDNDRATTRGFGYSDFDERGGFDEENMGWLDNSYGGGVCVHTDAPVISLGTLQDTYKNDADMTMLFDGGKACTKKVEVTLSDLVISYSDQFGTLNTSATIKNIKEIS